MACVACVAVCPQLTCVLCLLQVDYGLYLKAMGLLDEYNRWEAGQYGINLNQRDMVGGEEWSRLSACVTDHCILLTAW